MASEIDFTRRSLNRFPIYARLGVPEIWCCDQGELSIDLLQNEQHERAEQSRVFPSLKVQELPELIEACREQGRLALRKAIRTWAKAQLA